MLQAKILLADDDRVIAATMSDDLIDIGYQVITASNGEEAVEQCISESPDLAILDVRMPIMDGIEAASHIKEETTVPFIFLSAYSDKEIVDKAAENGALGYLIKPISAERMVPVIETALARAKDLNEIVNTNVNLLKSLETRRHIDIAIGLLMQRYGLKRQESFELLRKISRTERTKMEDVAVKLVDAAEALAIPHAFLK